MDWQREKLLVLAKTYPMPSKKYREITCVAALTEMGELRRVFPVPFRFLQGEQQFKKWEWMNCSLLKSRDDHRPESHKVDATSIERTGEIIGTENQWAQRKRWLEPHLLPSFLALENRRQQSGETLGVLRPTRLLSLEITPTKTPDWTDDEREKLTQLVLFEDDAHQRAPLRKVPFRFHYRYECEGAEGVEENKHQILDWEAQALYWKCVRSYGDDWESKFRQKLEDEFRDKELLLLMGTVHRFPNQWLIIGLYYPPPTFQPSLF